jgi:hypothetical protein
VLTTSAKFLSPPLKKALFIAVLKASYLGVSQTVLEGLLTLGISTGFTYSGISSK